MTHVRAGLGGHVARRFAKEGFAVALLSRTKAKLSPVEDAIKQEGGRAISIQCDAGAFRLDCVPSPVYKARFMAHHT